MHTFILFPMEAFGPRAFPVNRSHPRYKTKLTFDWRCFAFPSFFSSTFLFPTVLAHHSFPLIFHFLPILVHLGSWSGFSFPSIFPYHSRPLYSHPSSPPIFSPLPPRQSLSGAVLLFRYFCLHSLSLLFSSLFSILLLSPWSCFAILSNLTSNTVTRLYSLFHNLLNSKISA